MNSLAERQLFRRGWAEVKAPSAKVTADRESNRACAREASKEETGNEQQELTGGVRGARLNGKTKRPG